MVAIAVAPEEEVEAAEVVVEELINLGPNPTRRMLSSSAADHEVVAEEDRREAVTVVATSTRARIRAGIEVEATSQGKRARSR